MRHGKVLLPTLLAYCALALLSALPMHALAEMAPRPQAASEGAQPSPEETNPWSAPLRISGGVFAAANPALAVDEARGLVHLAWEESTFIHYAYRDAVGWHFDIYPVPGNSPALAVDQDGILHLVYVGQDGDIRHAGRGPDGWHPPSNVSNTSGQSGQPDIAIAADQGIHVVWADKIGETYRIYHAHSPDGGASWLAMQAISGGTSAAPSLAASPSGRLGVAWQGRLASADGGLLRIYAASYDGHAWTQPVTVSLGLRGDARDPDLDIDSRGQAHLVWEEDTEAGSSSVHYAQGAMDTWATPIVLSSGRDRSRYPCLALGPDDRVDVVWNVGHMLLYRQRDRSVWGNLEPIVAGQDGIRQAALAIDAAGVTYAAWSARGEAELWHVYFSERSPHVTPLPSPSPAVTSQPTGVLSPTPAPSATGAPSRHLLPYFFLGHESARLGSAAGLVRSVEAGSVALPQSEPGWTWSPPVNVSSTSRESQNVALATGLDGTVYAVWQEQYSSSTTILYFSLLRDGSWSFPVPFYAGKGPSLAVSPGGDVHLVYANEFGGNNEIYYSNWLGDHWAAAVNVSNTPLGDSAHPAVAVKSDGRLVVVWTETLEGQSRIYYAWQNGGLWSNYLVSASWGGESPDVAVERGDRAWVTWQVLEGRQRQIYAASGDGEHEWGEAQNISSPTGADSSKSEIVGVPSLGAFLVWQGSTISGTQIYYSDNKPFGDWWEEPRNVSQTLGLASEPSIAVDEAGNIHLVWVEDAQLLYRRGQAGDGTWSSTVSIASQVGGLGLAALDAESEFRLHAAWEQASLGGQHDIYYRAASMPTPLSLRIHLPVLLRP